MRHRSYGAASRRPLSSFQDVREALALTDAQRDAFIANTGRQIMQATDRGQVELEMAKAVNSARGKAGHKRGHDFEAALMRTHTIYEARGHAKLSKLNPTVGGPPTALRFIASSDADFLGWCLIGDGARPVAFDAKTTHAASFSVPKIEKNARTLLRQIKFLRAFGKGPGCIAFLLVADPDLECAWLLFEKQLAQLETGAAVLLRTKARGGGITHHQPGFRFSTMEEMAQHNAPRVDWLRALLAFGVGTRVP